LAASSKAYRSGFDKTATVPSAISLAGSPLTLTRPSLISRHAVLDRHSSHGGPGRDVDERPGFVEKCLDLAPLAHEDIELVKRVNGLFAAEDYHAGAALEHRANLGAVLLDVTVPGHD
jgi:hypothetical protein